MRSPSFGHEGWLLVYAALLVVVALVATRCSEARESAICRHAMQREFHVERAEAEAILEAERCRP